MNAARRMADEAAAPLCDRLADLRCLDPALTDVERAALARWAVRQAPRMTRQMRTDLERVIEPVYAVLTSRENYKPSGVRKSLLLATHERGTACWS
ncbi:hypothetical protein [Aeromicrobium sp. PE09-221]|uniref:hypothetical protein n=1 Tax=Aeromicrobium sp. PE09-221 TaxID=1898043 RepID=UPI000B3E97A5|nr:hypothetical protein [Aeromicrobium sp. PE09-221]